jgi:hypothetical protein
MALQQPQCGEMENAISSLKRRLKNVALSNVASNFINLHSRIAHRTSQVFHGSTHEIVVDDDILYILPG